MAANRFGESYCFTTFGESHGKAVGVVIDGCPAGIPLDKEVIHQALHLRAPGQTPWTSPRKEPDHGELLSGVFSGVTTGAPIAFVVYNQDAKTSAYAGLKEIYRPGHANYTYLEKYGVFDYRGGGRASARETVGRVVAGAVANQFLISQGVQARAYLGQVGSIHCPGTIDADRILQSPIFCPDPVTEKKIITEIEQVLSQGDSLGGVVRYFAEGLPVGLGEPIYQKLEAKLASAMLSIPAAKGIEVGSGFASAEMTGSTHNDPYVMKEGRVKTKKNDAGGILAGISTGETLWGQVAFKPTSSIKQEQQSVSTKGTAVTFSLPPGSRHDPCVAIRAVPVVEAMLKCVLMDAFLQHRSSQA